MESLRTLWTIVYIVGLGSFVAVAVAVVPLGLRDLLRLLRDLESEANDG